MFPKDVYILSPRACDYVPYMAKGLWDGKIVLDYSSWFNLITWVLKSRESFLAAEDQQDGSVKMTQSVFAGFEDGWRGHKPRNVSAA